MYYSPFTKRLKALPDKTKTYQQQFTRHVDALNVSNPTSGRQPRPQRTVPTGPAPAQVRPTPRAESHRPIPPTKPVQPSQPQPAVARGERSLVADERHNRPIINPTPSETPTNPKETETFKLRNKAYRATDLQAGILARRHGSPYNAQSTTENHSVDSMFKQVLNQYIQHRESRNAQFLLGGLTKILNWITNTFRFLLGKKTIPIAAKSREVKLAAARKLIAGKTITDTNEQAAMKEGRLGKIVKANERGQLANLSLFKAQYLKERANSSASSQTVKSNDSENGLNQPLLR